MNASEDAIRRASTGVYAAQAALAAAEAQRDDAIRAALADGTRVVDLVSWTGLSRPRIYQIRDRSR